MKEGEVSELLVRFVVAVVVVDFVAVADFVVTDFVAVDDFVVVVDFVVADFVVVVEEGRFGWR